LLRLTVFCMTRKPVWSKSKYLRLMLAHSFQYS
jgi:hypothetical protein